MSLPFHPCWWLPNGHLQTCIAALMPRPTVQTISEYFTLPDGDELELCWLHPEKDHPALPTLLFLHGLEGSVHSHYIQGMLSLIKEQGWRAAVLHFRGSHGRVNKKAESYHAGKTDDLLFALQKIRERYPTSPCTAIGYSLGANVLLKFLGEAGEQCFLETAIAVSPPFDLAASAKYMNTGLGRIYERYFIKKMKKSILQKMARGIHLPISTDTLKRISSFYDFDEHITAPIHGFQSADDYYNRSSCRYFLNNIATPTLIIHAEDDPLIPRSTIPNPEHLPGALQLEVHTRGGHIGFIKGGSLRHPQYWLEERIMAHLHSRHH